MSVFCECCMRSVRGLYDWPITPLRKNPAVCDGSERDLDT